MTSTIQAVGRVLRGSDPKQVPVWTSVSLIDPATCPSLGQVGRRTWYDWPAQRLELEEVGELLEPNDPAIAAAPYFKMPVAGGYQLRPLRAHPRGTFAALSTRGLKAPKPAPAARPIDALANDLLLNHTSTHHAVASYRVRGAQAIVDRLARKGVTLRLSIDRAHLIASAPGGRSIPATAQLIEATRPLLLAHLRGEPLRCVVTAHGKDVPEATTLTTGGAPWCGQCS